MKITTNVKSDLDFRESEIEINNDNLLMVTNGSHGFVEVVDLDEFEKQDIQKMINHLQNYHNCRKD